MSIMETERILNFDVLKEDEVFLTTNRGSCRVNKKLLAENCTFFQVLFHSEHSHLWKENIERKIDFNWLNIEVLAFLVKTLEHPRSEIDSNMKLVQLAEASAYFDCVSLKLMIIHHCEKVIGDFSKLNRNKLRQIFKILPTAHLYGFQSLKSKCIGWLARYFSDTWKAPEFEKLAPDLQEGIYQATVDRVNAFDGKTIVFVQEIVKLKASFYFNNQCKGRRFADELEISLYEMVLKNFSRFADSLIKTDSKTTKIVWLSDFLGQILRYVGSKLTIQNVCGICTANNTLIDHGYSVGWGEDTVMKRLVVLRDRCKYYLTSMVHVIKRENPGGWQSLSPSLKEDIDWARNLRLQSTSQPASNEGGLFFIGFDNSAQIKPPPVLSSSIAAKPRARRPQAPSQSADKSTGTSRKTPLPNKSGPTSTKQGSQRSSAPSQTVRVKSKPQTSATKSSQSNSALSGRTKYKSNSVRDGAAAKKRSDQPFLTAKAEVECKLIEARSSRLIPSAIPSRTLPNGDVVRGPASLSSRTHREFTDKNIPSRIPRYQKTKVHPQYAASKQTETATDSIPPESEQAEPETDTVSCQSTNDEAEPSNNSNPGPSGEVDD